MFDSKIFKSQLKRHLSAFPLRGLEQKVTWLQGWANIPWVGLDTDACKYLDGNCTRQSGGALSLTYPVKILSFYPAVIKSFIPKIR